MERKNISPNLTNNRAGAARSRSRSRSLFKKKGAGAGKKLAGSPALVLPELLMQGIFYVCKGMTHIFFMVRPLYYGSDTPPLIGS